LIGSFSFAPIGDARFPLCKSFSHQNISLKTTRPFVLTKHGAQISLESALCLFPDLAGIEELVLRVCIFLLSSADARRSSSSSSFVGVGVGIVSAKK